MSISGRKLKVGLRFRYEFRHEGQRIQSRYTYLSKRDARAAEKEHHDRLSGETLRDLFKARLEDMRLKGMSRDYLSENRRYYIRAQNVWGENTPVRTIDKPKAHDLIQLEAARLAQAGKTNHKLNGMIRCLRAFFYWSIDERGIMMENPFYKFKLYPIALKQKYIPSDRQVAAVRKLLTRKQRSLFDFIEETGCRIMEAVSLQVDDINLRAQTVTLWTRKAKNRNLTPRIIPFPHCLKDKQLPKAGAVFKTWDAYPRFLEEAMVLYKKSPVGYLSPTWSWHNLRHRRASLWAAAGMSTFEIMSRLGHNNLSTTMQYLQLLGYSAL